MLIRRLFAPLLLPLLLGVSVQRVDVRTTADAGLVAFVASDAISADPALPGSAAAAQLSAFDAPAPPRTHERHRTSALSRSHGVCADARAAALERGFLRYARDLGRARLNIPTTSGNPPPTSAS